MKTESNGSNLEQLARGREPSAVQTMEAGFYARLDRLVWFRPLVTGMLVVVTGLLLAPRLATRSYPRDEALIGTPATETIKAPFDFQATDTETTERLRRESQQRTRRVYAFDSLAGEGAASRVEAAFEVVAQKKSAVLERHGRHDERAPLTDAQADRIDAELALAVEEARPEIERLLRTPLKADENALLEKLGYDPRVGVGLAAAIREVGSRPIIDQRADLAMDEKDGVVIRPNEGGKDIIVNDPSRLADLAQAETLITASLSEKVELLRPEEREILAGMAVRLVGPTLRLDQEATQIAREVARVSVEPVKIAIKEGEVVVRDGERITPRHIMLFEELSRHSDRASIWLAAFGGALVALVMLLTVLAIGRGRVWNLKVEARDVLFLSALFGSSLVGFRLWLIFAAAVQQAFPSVPAETFIVIMPVAAAAMITRLVLREEHALLFAVVHGLVLGLMVEGFDGSAVYAVVGAIVGASTIGTMSRRSDLMRAGVLTGLSQAAVAVGLQLFATQTAIHGYLALSAAAFGSGLLAAIVALALTAVVEAVFGYTTDLKLLELANLNHPALKELIVQAPGSYHHSIIVGALVEAAAEAIGANALLARVMAYYHDVGKGCNPSYFSENQRGGQNPHNKLKPSMSAMIIRRHVADGLEMARRYRLGELIAAAIAEHHGTTLIQFFFNKAKETEDESSPVSERDYRYNGRKPQSRETALVMLGDAVEAASRSLAEPTPARLQGLVNRIINLKFTDGQLEESDLTLRDLHTIAKAFTRVLKSIHHGRPEYPGVLNDLSGKKSNGDSDPKPPKRAEDPDTQAAEDRRDNIRRLGLDGR